MLTNTCQMCLFSNFSFGLYRINSTMNSVAFDFFSIFFPFTRTFETRIKFWEKHNGLNFTIDGHKFTSANRRCRISFWQMRHYGLGNKKIIIVIIQTHIETGERNLQISSSCRVLTRHRRARSKVGCAGETHTCNTTGTRCLAGAGRGRPRLLPGSLSCWGKKWIQRIIEQLRQQVCKVYVTPCFCCELTFCPELQFKRVSKQTSKKFFA